MLGHLRELRVCAYGWTNDKAQKLCCSARDGDILGPEWVHRHMAADGIVIIPF